MREGAGPPPGLLAALRRLGSTALEIVHTRIELVATELDEERARIAASLGLALVAGFCLALGTLLAVLFLVALFWDTYRLLVLGLLAGGFLTAGGLAVAAFRSRLARRPRLFARTLDELAQDRRQLDGEP